MDLKRTVDRLPIAPCLLIAIGTSVSLWTIGLLLLLALLR